MCDTCRSCRWKQDFYKDYLQQHANLTQWIQNLHQNVGNQLSPFCSETVHDHFADTSMMNTIQPSYKSFNKDGVHHLHPEPNFDYDAFNHLDIAEKCKSGKGKKRNKGNSKMNILQENYKFSNRNVLHHLYPEPNFDYNAFNHFDVDDKCESGKSRKRNKGTRKVNSVQPSYKFFDRDVLHHLYPEPNFDYDAFNHFEVVDECESEKAESVKSDSSYIIGSGDELYFDPGSLLDNRKSSESEDSSSEKSEKNLSDSEDFEIVDVHQEFEYVQLDRFGNMPESRDGRSGMPNAQKDANEEKELKEYLYGSEAETIAGLETATKLDYNRNCDLYQPFLWPVLPIRINRNKNRAQE